MTDIPPSPLKMCEGHVLVQENDRKQSSVIHLSDISKDRREWGLKEFVVVAVGPRRTLDNGHIKDMPVKVGDKVMPLFNQVVAFDIRGRKYLAMPQEAIIGIEDESVMAFLESDDQTKLLTSTSKLHG